MPTAGNAPCPAHPPATTRTLLLATDLQQSILAELDRSGPNLRAYTAYGSPSSLRPTSTGLGFNGQLGEHPTGWHHLGNGHRVYNPVLMRFHSPDRLSPFGAGGVNAYAYCGGSPVTRVDPSGAWWVSTLVQGIGTLLGGIFAGAAVNRVAHAVVHRLPQSLGARLGNVAGFYGGVSAVVVRPLGVPAAITQAVPRLMQGVSVVGNGVSQTLTGGGALALNRDMLQKTLNTARQTGQPLSRIAIETAKEVTGYNLIRGQPLGQVSHRAADVPLESVTVIASAVRTQGQNPT
ncbi:RHS repeat-associated core domain-containing protein [Pseudomonas sp. NPDC087626]|uniref:RHS repeat-associated core domain-containing protein n=1 Tax=Pseudomonas sp. NPDC087626 TaxID=3364444 RepID=UPI00380E1BF0